jgi:glycosyltransferase involved in cell wall biosynthesis
MTASVSPAGATVSVVIPCYNAGAYLAEALASVAGQRRPAREVIVIDDRSTDDSVAIAQAHGARVLELPANGGAAAARNAGIAAASSDVVAFLDADDYWAPDHLERVVALLDRFPDVGLAFGLERRFGAWTGEDVAYLPPETPVDAFWACLRRNPISNSGVVVRRAELVAIGGYDAGIRYAEDYDLWLRLSTRTRFACVDAVTCFHRGHSAQASRAAARIAEGAFRVRHRLWERGAFGPIDRGRYAAVMLEAWRALLGETWRAADPERFDAALALGAYVPRSRRVERQWRRMASLLPFWAAARAALRRVRNGVRAGAPPATPAS